MNRFEINERGFWETETTKGHMHDSTLCEGIIKYFTDNGINKVYDFGCGKGSYSRIFDEKGFDVKAFDGNPNTEKITKGIGSVRDLSVPVDLGDPADCLMTLEVGEHIPKDFESIFIDNICRNTNSKVLMSWATVGQSGDGHVNCQNNDYIIDEMNNRGFDYDKEASLELRKTAKLYWFRKTLMIFNKRS
jgi:hypothetical protein